jgi:hypothetical protein
MQTCLTRHRCLPIARQGARHQTSRRTALIGLLALTIPGRPRLTEGQPDAKRLVMRDGWLLHHDDR